MEELNRSFLGIRLPVDVQQKISEVQLALRHKSGSDVVRWTPADTIQIILLALGELPVYTLDQVKKAIPAIASRQQPFQISLEGLGGTPSALQPRFPWLGITGQVDQLSSLVAALESGLGQMLPGYQPKPFIPHVDLGRIKIESEQNRTSLGRALRMNPVGRLADIEVREIELLRSTATSMGVHMVSEGKFLFGAMTGGKVGL